MARFDDTIEIWIASPRKEDDGEVRIVGYENLHKVRLYCVPAIASLDYEAFGDKVNRIKKFSFDEPIDINYDGGDGIYLEEPKKDGLYYINPPYISSPVTTFGKQHQFTAEKQTY